MKHWLHPGKLQEQKTRHNSTGNLGGSTQGDLYKVNIQHFVVSVLRGALGYFLFDSVNDSRIRERAKITKLITLSSNDLAHNTTHDLEELLHR